MSLPTTYAKIIIDEVSTTVTYIGYNMDQFALTNSPTWAIFKITAASGTSPTGVTTIQPGISGTPAPSLFNEKWDDRLTLTYI
jgi:hypothetical protein